MILRFTVGNYLSFKENQTVDFEASALKELATSNIGVSDYKRAEVLRAIGIYGANASGKSNFIKAINFLKEFITNSSLVPINHPIGVEPFKLSTTTIDQPSYFEICFLIEEFKYRYVLAITKQGVQYEKLYSTKRNKETIIFERMFNNFTFGKDYLELNTLTRFTKINTSFLSLIAQFNIPVGTTVLSWFSKIKILLGNADESQLNYTANLIQDIRHRDLIYKLIRNADLGFTEVKTKTSEGKLELATKTKLFSQLLDSYDNISFEINTVHKRYNENYELDSEVNFSINEESQGTQKYFAMAGKLSEALLNGSLMLIDELDSKLHPLLTASIIKYFNSKGNRHNAQLVFATHNTITLDNSLLRRDQIYLTQKNKFEESNLYPLSSIKTIRNDNSYSKNYISGSFGAIPEIEDQLDLF